MKQHNAAQSFASIRLTPILHLNYAFHGINTGGTDAGTIYPANATKANFYDANANFGGRTEPSLAELEFTGLDTNKTYDFTFFASRMSAVSSETRITEYSLVGSACIMLRRRR